MFFSLSENTSIYFSLSLSYEKMDSSSTPSALVLVVCMLIDWFIWLTVDWRRLGVENFWEGVGGLGWSGVVGAMGGSWRFIY